MRVLTLLLLLLLAPSVMAETKAEKIDRLIKLMHLDQAVQASAARSRADYEARANALMAHERAAFSPTPAYEQQYQALHHRFVDSVESPYSQAAYMKVVAQVFDKQFSGSELDRLISFYASPLGQKERQVEVGASDQALVVFQAQSRAIDEAALQAFTDDFHKLSAQCRCLDPGPL